MPNEKPPPIDDGRWLLLLCLSRTGFAVINTAYAGLIPLLRPAWQMSAGQAGSVQLHFKGKVGPGLLQ